MTSTSPDDEGSGVPVYGGFLKDELDAQAKRKDSLEQRGLAVVTTSGVLATLLFAVAGLSTKKAATFVLPHSARIWLVVGMGLFVAAAVAALAANYPLPYEAVDPEGPKKRLKEEPVRDALAAHRDVALTRAKVVASAKQWNGIKAAMLFAAMSLEVAAVVSVTVAVAIVVAP